MTATAIEIETEQHDAESRRMAHRADRKAGIAKCEKSLAGAVAFSACTARIDRERAAESDKHERTMTQLRERFEAATKPDEREQLAFEIVDELASHAQWCASMDERRARAEAEKVQLQLAGNRRQILQDELIRAPLANPMLLDELAAAQSAQDWAVKRLDVARRQLEDGGRERAGAHRRELNAAQDAYAAAQAEVNRLVAALKDE